MLLLLNRVEGTCQTLCKELDMRSPILLNNIASQVLLVLSLCFF
jgi:hypothetical protein